MLLFHSRNCHRTNFGVADETAEAAITRARTQKSGIPLILLKYTFVHPSVCLSSGRNFASCQLLRRKSAAVAPSAATRKRAATCSLTGRTERTGEDRGAPRRFGHDDCQLMRTVLPLRRRLLLLGAVIGQSRARPAALKRDRHANGDIRLVRASRRQGRRLTDDDDGSKLQRSGPGRDTTTPGFSAAAAAGGVPSGNGCREEGGDSARAEPRARGSDAARCRPPRSCVE